MGVEDRATNLLRCVDYKAGMDWIQHGLRQALLNKTPWEVSPAIMHLVADNSTNVSVKEISDPYR